MAVTINNAMSGVAVLIRTGSTKLCTIQVSQRAVAAPLLHLQLYDTASPVVGTTAPIKVVPIPAGAINMQQMSYKETYSGSRGGIEFATALACAVTTTHDGAIGPTAGQEPQVIIRWEPLG